MATKRKTLPKEIDELLKVGDLEELKKRFAQCEPNALHINKFGSNIFSRTPMSREFAVWAKEQGADINFADHYGKTPIFYHASSWCGDVQLLIDLGAEVNVASGGVTPLHYAAMYGRPKAVKALLDSGADVEAKPKDVFGRRQSPLEMTLIQNRVPFSTLMEVCTLLLDHGAKKTNECRNAVDGIGKNFERVKGGIQNADFLKEQTESLQKLYMTFGVTPAEEISVHDGVSPIIISEVGFVKQYNKLWEYLVPPHGKAKTAQGEAMRIVGKVSYEILDNGGMNWDGDFRKMLRVLPEYFRLGNPLSEEDIAEVERLTHILRDGRGIDEPTKLCAYAVAWVLKNPKVIAPLPADYAR